MKKQKAWAILTSVALLVALLPTISTPTLAAIAPGSVELNRRAAAEGIVLLENSGILPLAPGAKVAMFGVHQIRFMRGGGGSGQVNTAYTRYLLQAMEDKSAQGKIALDTTLASAYRAQTSVSVVYSTQTEATTVNNVSIANQAANAANRGNDVAIFVYGRNSSEGGDRGNSAGNWLISANETTVMNAIAANFDNIIVVLNVCSVTDLSWLDTYGDKIKAVVCPFLPGMEGADAVADVLCGDVNPSGKLADTWPKSYNYWPSNGMFSTSNRVTYADDIYVGYRYFETADPNYEQVRYPFGFGLSYTSFSVSNKTVSVADDTVTVTATVTNTGVKAGKEVLQVYSQGPAGSLNKPARELRAFEKTKLLAPNESEILTMTFPVGDMASYDDLGVTGVKSAWVMEAGGYNLYLGNSVRNARENGILFTYNQPALRVVDQLTEELKPSVAFDRWVGFDGATKITAPVGSFAPVQLSATAPVSFKATDIFSASNAVRREFVPLTYERCVSTFNNGSDISYKLNAPVAGQYKIAFEYANGNNAATSNAINIFVNEVQQTGNTITFLKTGDGGLQQYYTFVWGNDYNITLPAGESTLRLRSLGQYANLKTIRITPNDAVVAATSTAAPIVATANAPVLAAAAPEISASSSIFPSEEDGAYMLADVYNGDITMKEFLAQLTMDDLYYLVQGHGGVSPGVNTGSIGRLYKYGIPGTDTADGPAGLRLDNVGGTTAWPTGTLLACTWDKALVREVGVAVGTEYDMHKVDYWLAPGMNIHRDPLCGRNFEYYSEDPYLCGQMAMNAALGVQSMNVGVTLKHFYANNREASRSAIDTIISERASREIYLKGFEIAVRGANPWCIMTSYNLVNSQETAELYDLLMNVLRGEWGFKGMVMTDWGNDSAHFKEELAGNDVKMSSGNTSNLTSAYDGGVLSRSVLEANVERVLNVIMRTSKFFALLEDPDLYSDAPVIHKIGEGQLTEIRASAYIEAYGGAPPRTESTSDSQYPGENVGYMDANGNLVYYLDVQQGGLYSLAFRYAANSSPYGGYRIQIADSLLPDGSPNYVTAATIPAWSSTGDWQAWRDSAYYAMTLPLNVGEYYFRITMTGGGTNINVIRFRLDTPYKDIHFDNNGADTGDMKSISLEPSIDTYTVPACTFARAGYTFAGWMASGSVTGLIMPGDTIDLTGNVTLTAQWVHLNLDAGQAPSFVIRKNMIAKINVDTNSENISFVSSNPAVVSVTSDGVVTGKSIGVAVIQIKEKITGLTINVVVNCTN